MKIEPKFQDLMEACPFDGIRSFEGQITPKLFRSRILHSPDDYLGRLDTFGRLLDHPAGDRQVIFVSGFAGSGKTTFLKNFFHKNSSFQPTLLDFNSYLSDSPESADIVAAHVIKRYLKSLGKESLNNALLAAKTYQEDLEDCFSEEFEERLSGTKSIAAEQKQLLKCMTFRDAMCLLLLSLMDRHSGDKINCVVLDNLDAVDVDYLSDDFRQNILAVLAHFAGVVSLAPEWPAKGLSFTRHFRFILCFRDANSAVLNAHLKDRWGARVQRIPFVIQFEPSFYRDLLLKRAGFVEDYFGESQTEIAKTARRLSAVIRTFVTDWYFENALAPLYNFDIKNLVVQILDLVQDFENPILDEEDFARFEEGVPADQNYLFGLRGALMHGVIRSLRSQNFIQGYQLIRRKGASDLGYCYHQRVILTVLLNLANHDRAPHRMSQGKATDYIRLSDLLDRVWGVYHYKEVFRVLAKCFLYHRYDWVHLISVRGKAIEHESDFAEEIEMLADDLGPDWSLEDARPKNFLNQLSQKTLSKLRTTRLSTTPAAYAYLRFVLTHFEFYSVLTENYTPLFKIAWNERGGGTKRRCLEVIDKVYESVATHVGMMDVFYRKKYEGQFRLEEPRFRDSSFSFKFSGKNHARGDGMFHATRVIHSHLGYLENYRSSLLSSSSSDEEQVAINRGFVDRMGKYVSLMKKGVDSEVEPYVRFFEDSHRKMKKMGFTGHAPALFPRRSDELSAYQDARSNT